MSKINCDVSNCSHNTEHTCYANAINVGGKSAEKDSDTCCGSFLDSRNYSHLTNNINQAGQGCSAITCNVGTCTYNSNAICTANTIKVHGNNPSLYTETECTTFKTT